jgi:hypothetical protein
MPSNGLGVNHIENIAPVFLAACLFEGVYLATGFSGSIAHCFEQIRHNIMYRIEEFVNRCKRMLTYEESTLRTFK